MISTIRKVNDPKKDWRQCQRVGAIALSWSQNLVRNDKTSMPMLPLTSQWDGWRGLGAICLLRPRILWQFNILKTGLWTILWEWCSLSDSCNLPSIININININGCPLESKISVLPNTPAKKLLSPAPLSNYPMPHLLWLCQGMSGWAVIGVGRCLWLVTNHWCHSFHDGPMSVIGVTVFMRLLSHSNHRVEPNLDAWHHCRTTVEQQCSVENGAQCWTKPQRPMWRHNWGIMKRVSGAARSNAQFGQEWARARDQWNLCLLSVSVKLVPAIIGRRDIVLYCSARYQ